MIPLRVVLVTFIGTLLAFAVSLLLGIVGISVGAYVRHAHSNLTLAYRLIALPAAGIAGAILFVSSLSLEIHHYRRSRVLAGIERMS
jgi:hypothetical protein